MKLLLLGAPVSSEKLSMHLIRSQRGPPVMVTCSSTESSKSVIEELLLKGVSNMDDGKAFNHWCKRWNRMPVEQAAHDRYLKRNPDNGPSLTTRQRMNRIETQKKEQLEANTRAIARKELGPVVWKPDPKWLEKKKKLKQNKIIGIFGTLSKRAMRRLFAPKKKRTIKC